MLKVSISALLQCCPAQTGVLVRDVMTCSTGSSCPGASKNYLEIRSRLVTLSRLAAGEVQHDIKCPGEVQAR